MRELAAILRSHPDKALLPALPLPRFACKTIRVLLNDHNQPSGTQQVGLLSAVHPLWKPLTAPLLPASEASAGNWLQPGGASKKAASEPAPCVLGEWVFVEIEVENPMHVQLGLSSLKLKCTLTRDGQPPLSTAAGGQTAASAPTTAPPVPAPAADPLGITATRTAEPPALAPAAAAAAVATTPAELETDVQALTLPAGRRSLVRLGVRSLVEGHLSIDGVLWTLNDVAHGEHALVLHGRRLNNTKAERTGKVYAFDQSLKMRVVPPMPLLQAHIDMLPASMMLGQVAQATLVVANVGRTPLSDAKVRLSQPAFCLLSDVRPAAEDFAQAASSAEADDAGGDDADGATSTTHGLGERKRSGATASSSQAAAAAATAAAATAALGELHATPTVVCNERARLAVEGTAATQAPSATPVISSRIGAAGASAASAAAPDYSIVTLPLPNGQLHPGERLKLTLWIRAAALGAHALHLVFVYSPSTPTGALQRRLCPLSARLKVQPSLDVRSTIRPLSGPSMALPGREEPPDEAGATDDDVGSPEYLLALQVQNVAAARRLLVKQVSCISAGWTTSPLCAAAAPPASLEPTEANALYLRLRPRRPPPAAGSVGGALDRPMTHCEVVYRGSLIDSRADPHMPALLRTGAPAVTEADSPDLARPYGRPARRRELTPTEVAAADGLSLVVHWVDADGSANGELHLTGLRPQLPLEPPLAQQGGRSAPSAPADTRLASSSQLMQSLGASLRVRVDAMAQLDHDFEASPLCVLPLSVVVQNCTQHAHVAFALHLAASPTRAGAASDASAAAAGSQASPERLNLSGECFWLGCTQFPEQWLSPASSAVLSLKLAVTAPGTYTLDGVRIVACAWRPGAGGEAQRPNTPVECPPPPSRTVQVAMRGVSAGI